MIRIGVLGAGHLGKIHIKLLQELSEQFQLVGYYDHHPENQVIVAERFGLRHFESEDALLAEVDAVDIVTPTLTHFDLATKAIRRFKHVFIEKPVTETFEQAKSLAALAEEAGVRVMVGHVERYNPAFVAIRDRNITPLFIQIDRLAQYNPRGTDVSVVHDLMIHDVDLALKLAGSTGIKRVSGSGMPVVSPTADIANARIEFHNGCVAQLTTSRVAFENRRLIQLFTKDAFYVLDLLNKQASVHSLFAEEETARANGEVVATYQTPEGNRWVSRQALPVPELNAIKQELADFGEAILSGKPTPIPLVEAADALQVVEEIYDKLV